MQALAAPQTLQRGYEHKQLETHTTTEARLVSCKTLVWPCYQPPSPGARTDVSNRTLAEKGSPVVQCTTGVTEASSTTITKLGIRCCRVIAASD